MKKAIFFRPLRQLVLLFVVPVFFVLVAIPTVVTSKDWQEWKTQIKEFFTNFLR